MTAFASGGCERSATAISRTTTPVAVDCITRAGDDGGDARPQIQPVRDMEQRAPADLGVARSVGGNVENELVGDPIQRFLVLHDRDREVERPE